MIIIYHIIPICLDSVFDSQAPKMAMGTRCEMFLLGLLHSVVGIYCWTKDNNIGFVKYVNIPDLSTKTTPIYIEPNITTRN